MTDIEMAREAAATASFHEKVQKKTRSGDFDAWPIIQAALNAIRAARSRP